MEKHIDSEKLKKFFGNRVNDVNNILNNPYFLWTVVIIILIVLFIAWIVMNNVNLTSQYIRIGPNAGADFCSQANIIMNNANDKFVNEISKSKLDDAGKKEAIDAFDRTKLLVTDCDQYNKLTIDSVKKEKFKVVKDDPAYEYYGEYL